MHYGYIHPLLLLPPVIPSSSLNPFFLTNFPPSAISSQQLFRERRDLVDTSSIRDGTLKGCVHRGCVFMVAGSCCISMAVFYVCPPHPLALKFFLPFG